MVVGREIQGTIRYGSRGSNRVAMRIRKLKEYGKASVGIGGVDNTTCIHRGNVVGGAHLVHNGTPPEREGVALGNRAGGGDVEVVYGGIE